MRRLSSLIPLVGFLVAPLLSSSCGGPRETVDSTTSLSTQQLTSAALQQAVNAFSDCLLISVAATCDQIDRAIPKSSMYRRTLIWRLRTAQICFRAQHESNALIALMQLWYYTAAINVRVHSTEVKAQLGTHQPLVASMTGDWLQQAENLALRSLPADAFARVKSDIEKSAAGGEIFSATSATDEAVFSQLMSTSRLEKIIAIPLSPFDPFSGVNQGAEAITRLSVTADRAVDLAEVYPQVIEWRLRLVALDIQELESVQSVVSNLNDLTAVAKALPVHMREQATLLLEHSIPAQVEAQRTLTGVRDASAALQGAMNSTQAAITSLDQLVARLTPAADPKATPRDPANAAPPFKITDYTVALNALASATTEVHATLTDLQQPAFSGRVAELTTTAVDHAHRAAHDTIDHLMWRMGQLIAFAGLCVAGLLVLAKWRRKA